MSRRIRAILALVALGLVVGAGYWIFTQYRAGQEFNRITHDLMNQDRHVEAAAAFEAMLPTAPAGMRDDVRRQAAECYRREGKRLELPLKEQARFLAKARAVDPDIRLTPEEERTIRVISK